MITVLTTIEDTNRVTETINTVDRLHELITVVSTTEAISYPTKLIVVEHGIISVALDWFDTEPPYVFPKVPLNDANLLALLFYKLGNHQTAFKYLTEDQPLYNSILVATYLQFGYEISADSFNKINQRHNQCIVQHYGNYEKRASVENLKSLYRETIAHAAHEDLMIFTAKHYCNLLLDEGAFKEAEDLMRTLQDKAISEEARHTIEMQLASALMAQLQIPYNTHRLNEISDIFDRGIEFYEKQGQRMNAGLVYIEASEIANYKGDYISSKELINKAILIFKEANIPEFLGEAGLRKATLLYTWSKNGSPQYYKPAINAFQDTLKVFKRDTHPQKFADIHHNMALIYSEIPVSKEERPIWTAFCASSFKKVLKFYTKERYPYEYAMASHNYATALMNFPEAKLHNNLNKAFAMFEDALSIRTAKAYPLERALTLLNQLELYWLLHNEDKTVEQTRYQEMLEKANSIKAITREKNLIEQAEQHLEQLRKLKAILQ